MKRFLISTALLASSSALFVSTALSAQKDEFTTAISGFKEALQSREDTPPSVKERLAQLPADGAGDAGALTGLLRELHPDFGAALKTAADDPVAGIEALETLSSSDDPFLAAESSYYAARVLIGEERFEEALPHLKKLRGDLANNTLRSGESLYYQGVCNANMLQRTEAADHLNGFVEKYPDASPRLIGSAWDLIASIERVHRGSIDDVASHMEFSRRKLGLTDAGEATQEVQSHIVFMLDELIEMAEEQEKQQPP